MGDLLEGVVQVLTLVNVMTALLGGGMAGYHLIGRLAADPSWVSPASTPRGVGLLVGWYSIAVGALFYMGQAVAGLLVGDPGWPRLASRFLLWLVFCAAMGAATWLRLHDHERQRRLEARERARRELPPG